MSQTLSIVIPTYQEAKRLPRTLQELQSRRADLERAGLRLEKVIVVDDGSKDETARVAQGFAGALPIELVSYPRNQGKGFAVRTGAIRSQSELTLIADADMSTPWMQAPRLRERLMQNFDIVIGSRSVPESRIEIRQPWYRERMGKTFNLLMRMMTGLPFRDTQCGFKLFKTAACAPLWPKFTVNRFAWDIEFLIWAQHANLRINEMGVEWNHQDESRVHPFKDSIEMLLSVVKIRLRLMKGRP